MLSVRIVMHAKALMMMKIQFAQNGSIRFTAIIKFLTVLVFFLFFFTSFLQRQVYDYDFWWHLATGKYIVENKSLPEEDPFSYTSHEAPSTRKALILKGYWLSEIIFYGVYSLWDLTGIIVLRSLLMLLFLSVIFLTIKKQGSSDLLALLFTVGVYLFSWNSLGERPQLFTFLAFSVILYLLEDFRLNGSKKMFLIPAIVLLLSNMHPGYIVCILLVSLYLAGEGISSALKRESGKRPLKALLLVWCLSIVAALGNPNGPRAFIEVFSLGEHAQEIVAHMPTFSFYARKLQPLDYSYLLFLLLSLIGIRYYNKLGLVQLLVLAAFTLLGFIAIRYVIFYMCVAAPVLAAIITCIREEKPVKSILGAVKVREGFSYLATFTVGAGLLLQAVPRFATYEFKADTSFSTQEGAANFLRDLRVNGNMFNEYGSGGYLIWRLYPEKKVFIDGRSLEFDVLEEYRTIASASVSPGRSWEDMLERYKITYVTMPPLLPQGEIYPLVEKLLEREDWVLIYHDHLSLIFLKDSPENSDIIKGLTKDKAEGLNTIIMQASVRAMKNRTNPYYLVTLGKVFLKMGKLDDAQKAFEMAYQRDPGNPEITEWLRNLQERRKQTSN